VISEQQRQYAVSLPTVASPKRATGASANRVAPTERPCVRLGGAKVVLRGDRRSTMTDDQLLACALRGSGAAARIPGGQVLAL